MQELETSQRIRCKLKISLFEDQTVPWPLWIFHTRLQYRISISGFVHVIAFWRLSWWSGRNAIRLRQRYSSYEIAYVVVKFITIVKQKLHSKAYYSIYDYFDDKNHYNCVQSALRSNNTDFYVRE